MLKIDLQFFGGRGASSGGAGGGGGALIPHEPVEVTNVKTGTGWTAGWKRKNAEATDLGNGVISLDAPNYTYERRNNNTTDATATITAGYVNTANNSLSGDWIGINFDKVKEIRGSMTYDLKSLIKEKGYKWDGESKSWKKPE